MKEYLTSPKLLVNSKSLNIKVNRSFTFHDPYGKSELIIILIFFSGLTFNKRSCLRRETRKRHIQFHRNVLQGTTKQLFL